MAADSVCIRSARPGDEVAIVDLIGELAVYEKLEHENEAEPAALAEHLFGASPVAESLVAVDGDEVVGYALFFTSYSTFLTRPGIYVEDLYVKMSRRGNGIGKLLLAAVARIAVARQAGRMEWAVLDWNEPAVEFYRSIGAEPMTGWTTQRVTGAKLSALADSAGD